MGSTGLLTSTAAGSRVRDHISMARIPTRAANLARQLVAITGTVPSAQGESNAAS
jgi:hypothetical protein